MKDGRKADHASTSISSFILHPSSFIDMASHKPQLSDEERLARDVFTRLAAAADEFEAYAHPHAERIAALADALARLFHLGRADRASLHIGALAHDLGEAAMKRDYIRRAGALEGEERLDLARHPVIGEQEAARAGADRAAQLVVRWSHEWWNGAGYPDALRREQIPLAARIFHVADAYCAFTDDRPFRRAATEDEARKHLAQWAGIEFDPRVVRAFLTLHGLPELRSYARRDAEEETSRQTTANEGDITRGGLVPEKGTNPYAQVNDASAADAPNEGGRAKVEEGS
ncbi:MAG: HD-GYP domain-containing protein [Pyrinomonadaceae bacterium]